MFYSINPHFIVLHTFFIGFYNVSGPIGSIQQIKILDFCHIPARKKIEYMSNLQVNETNFNKSFNKVLPSPSAAYKWVTETQTLRP